ncbi:MAG: sugar phosphate isomerase/epimerase family protein [Christensenellales bacterium]
MRKIGCTLSPGDYELAGQAGFDHVELSGKGVCGMEKAAYRGLLEMIRGGAIPCLGFNAYCPPDIRIAGPGFSENIIRSYALACRDRAAPLGVRLVAIGSPMSRMLPEGFDRLRARDQAVSFYRITADAFKEAGITVCVEALGRCYCNFINTLEEAADIVRLADRPNLKIVIDFYNMEHENEADMDLAPHLDEIAHVHISDDAGSPQRRWFLKREKAAVHAGRVRRLMEAGYQGDISLEVDLPLTLADAQQSLEALRAVVH